jgi:hypothetical protein
LFEDNLIKKKMIIDLPIFSIKVHINILKNIKNLNDLVDFIKKINEKKQNFILINPTFVISITHILTSIYKTLSQKKFKTKLLNSEVIFNLSNSTNVC